MALEHSVELRTPLLDRRVVDFALSRPRRERASGGAVKHLLRGAASGLLPASVLAPRPAKTGVLTDYFARGFRADPAGLVSDTFEAPVLADLGIVDAVSLQQAWLAYQKTGSGSGGHLYVAFQTELWLKSRTGLEIPKIEVHSARLRSPAAGNVQ
jgi:asparagine synthase (glutamine-hydrolysing)